MYSYKVVHTLWFMLGAAEEREETRLPMKDDDTGWMDVGVDDRGIPPYIC